MKRKNISDLDERCIHVHEIINCDLYEVRGEKEKVVEEEEGMEVLVVVEEEEKEDVSSVVDEVRQARLTKRQPIQYFSSLRFFRLPTN